MDENSGGGGKGRGWGGNQGGGELCGGKRETIVII